MQKFAAVLALTLLLPLAAQGAEPCKLTRLAAIDMSVDSGGGMTIPVSINGKTYVFAVDSQGARSMFTQTFARSLGDLPTKTAESLVWYGSIHLSRAVKATGVEVGGVHLGDPWFFTIPDDYVKSGISGVLASDFLDSFDIDLDFANGKLNLFSKEHCPNQVIYWTREPAAMLPFTYTNDGIALVMADVDGQPMKAMLDTSDSPSRMPMGVATRLFNLTSTSPGVEPFGHWTGNYQRYRYAFKALTVAGATIRNPEIVLTPGDESYWSDYRLSIGMSALSRLHIYIDKADRSIFLTGASAH